MFLQRYLLKHSLFGKLIIQPPSPSLSVIVVIPSFMEDHLGKTLHSLLKCYQSDTSAEIIVVLNEPEDDHQARNFHLEQSRKIAGDFDGSPWPVHTVHVQFPAKGAGVGMARKAGMDEGVRRFADLGKPDGILACLDADCLVQSDYFLELGKYFAQTNAKDAVSIGFMHNLQGLSQAEADAAQLYELHLLYFIVVQRLSGYPFAFHTVGSCMAVRAGGYSLQGGMNKRQAGEDFYFLHKFSAINRLGEIKKPLVFPSGRFSHRVPFGTGRAIGQILSDGGVWKSYDFRAIDLFCKIVGKIKSWYGLPHADIVQDIANDHSALAEFLIYAGLYDWLSDAKNNARNVDAFCQRVKKYFHPFQLMKWLHFAESRSFPRQEIQLLARDYLARHFPKLYQPDLTISALLACYRRLDQCDGRKSFL